MLKKSAVKKVVKKKSPAKKAVVKKSAGTPRVAKKKYTMSIDMNSEIFKSKGDSIAECLETFKPPFFKTKVVIVLSKGDKIASRVLSPFEMKRLLINNVSQIIFEKRMTLIMK